MLPYALRPRKTVLMKCRVCDICAHAPDDPAAVTDDLLMDAAAQIVRPNLQDLPRKFVSDNVRLQADRNASHAVNEFPINRAGCALELCAQFLIADDDGLYAHGVTRL